MQANVANVGSHQAFSPLGPSLQRSEKGTRSLSRCLDEIYFQRNSVSLLLSRRQYFQFHEMDLSG